jgi:hypothetical protein
MNSPTEFPWPKVVEVKPQGEQRLRVRFASGTQLLLDLSDLIERREAYWRLRHSRYFHQVAIDPLGGLCWPEGEDLAPDGLERYATHSSPGEDAQDGPEPGGDEEGAAPV